MSKRVLLTLILALFTGILYLSHEYLNKGSVVDRELSFGVSVPKLQSGIEQQPSLEEPHQITGTAQTYRLFNLTNRTTDHKTPDAIVYVPQGFDTSNPFRLIVFNHGLTNTVDDVLEIWEIEKHMAHAPPNSVLFIPEWAFDPKAYSAKAGRFHTPGFFRDMLVEVMSKVPPLEDYTLDNILSIDVIAYSGGFRAARTEMTANQLDSKIRSLALLDSLYEPHYFDDWLRDNARAIASGEKVYYNFFFDTVDNTRAQMKVVDQILETQHIPNRIVFKDLTNPEEILPLSAIEHHRIVYKWTTLSTSDFISHQQVVNDYFPLVIQALNSLVKDDLLVVDRHLKNDQLAEHNRATRSLSLSGGRFMAPPLQLSYMIRN